MQTLRKGREEHIPNDGQWLPQEAGGGDWVSWQVKGKFSFAVFLYF